jgi:septum site-determining protein MinC
VLTPEPPIADWLLHLEASIRGSAGFFVGRPAVLDLAQVKLSNAAIAHLVGQLEALGVRIMGIEGAADELGAGLPPELKGGRAAAVHSLNAASSKPAATQEPTSLLIDSPVRSGQSIFFPTGDVTVLGSVASGAEIVAGGSIHVYGTLRGRAMAGASGSGNKHARIFCGKIEAELLAIDGYYRTTEDLEPGLCARPAQAWLDGETLMISALG